MKNLPDFFRRGSFALSSNPYQEMQNLQRQMDRLFNEMWRGGSADVSSPMLSTPDFAPACDVRTTDSHYLMSFELPGVKKDDIKIALQDGMLTVSGERKDECEQKDKNHHHTERFYGSFSRSFQVPADIKAEQIEANYADGVLRVAIPTAKTSKSAQIQIGEGKPGFWDSLLGKKSLQPQTQAQQKRPAERVA